METVVTSDDVGIEDVVELGAVKLKFGKDGGLSVYGRL